MPIIALFFIIMGIFLFVVSIIKTLCNIRNKYPKFHNGDKRLGEILNNVTRYKTRNII